MLVHRTIVAADLRRLTDAESPENHSGERRARVQWVPSVGLACLGESESQGTVQIKRVGHRGDGCPSWDQAGPHDD